MGVHVLSSRCHEPSPGMARANLQSVTVFEGDDAVGGGGGEELPQSDESVPKAQYVPSSHSPSYAH